MDLVQGILESVMGWSKLLPRMLPEFFGEYGKNRKKTESLKKERRNWHKQILVFFCRLGDSFVKLFGVLAKKHQKHLITRSDANPAYYIS